MLSEQTVGETSGDEVSNAELLTSENYNDEMRLHSIKTCTRNDDLAGIQFSLAMNA